RSKRDWSSDVCSSDLPFIGIYAFTAPVLGRRYLSGDKTAISAISESSSITNSTALVFGGTAVFLLLLGAIMLGTSTWRSKNLPRDRKSTRLNSSHVSI